MPLPKNLFLPWLLNSHGRNVIGRYHAAHVHRFLLGGDDSLRILRGTVEDGHLERWRGERHRLLNLRLQCLLLNLHRRHRRVDEGFQTLAKGGIGSEHVEDVVKVDVVEVRGIGGFRSRRRSAARGTASGSRNTGRAVAVPVQLLVESGHLFDGLGHAIVVVLRPWA